MLYSIEPRDKIAISSKSLKLMNQLFLENHDLEEIFKKSSDYEEAKVLLKDFILSKLKNSKNVIKIYKKKHISHNDFKSLKWKEISAIRILDYIDYSGQEFKDLNLKGEIIINNPIKYLWIAYKFKRGGTTTAFFHDMLELFRQFNGINTKPLISKEKVLKWMDKYPSGLNINIIENHLRNRNRILNIIIKKIDSGEFISKKYSFQQSKSYNEKFKKALKWWSDYKFHLKFAVRSPELLNEFLDYSLSDETMEVLNRAREKGMPFFVNLHYLSLLLIDAPNFATDTDLAIRDYILYSNELVNEFGDIVAWEKEDVVEAGFPNAAGWILPTRNNVHRRYPEVAILIPDTVGRACAGLCSSCQRMYDFQTGRFHFGFETLLPEENWSLKLQKLMKYFENDSQLRDILITGGDAFMSTNQSLRNILDAVYKMAIRKIEANLHRKDNEKYAEIKRIRLGTRIPVYLPQRIDKPLIKLLSDFKKKAVKIGIEQFLIQTHFESPIEVTPIVKESIAKLQSAGWIVTNQLVFTTAASRRGHTSKLRKVLNDIGVLTYYTFSCKGYTENRHSFATNARAVQEQLEEKVIGKIEESHNDEISEFAMDAENIISRINSLRKDDNLPFLATDRNVLNIPAVGKSMSFRVIGITRSGRRILEFDYDMTRRHSPVVDKTSKVYIIESKSIFDYLNQLENIGENILDYKGIYGYSIGSSEPLVSIFSYPSYPFKVTEKMTNIQFDEIE